MDLSTALFRVKRYVIYWLQCVDQHSLQAPYVFELYNEVFRGVQKADSSEIATALHQLQSDHREVPTQSGAGSSLTTKKYTVSQIAKHGITDLRHAQLIQRIIDYHAFSTVLELGASIGVNTIRLCNSSLQSIVTVERNDVLIDVASELFKKLGLTDRIELVHADVEVVLRDFVKQKRLFGLIFLDANHTYEGTLAYSELMFRLVDQNHGVVVFDDINWSSGMRRAWDELSKKFDKGVVLETYQMGFLFFNPRLQRGKYIVDF
ncbi:O-methyltransferase [Reichenbachiella agariperforans]|uniref:O-methyltransferase n=1 Tax=Reichenbachiella agariperforans TaxID=156994 RepID=UPI001C08A042|nr:class I SAM-dependent methyltransferase [Reichenbachiella agariperforans]